MPLHSHFKRNASMLLASAAKNKSPGISSFNAFLIQRLRASSTRLSPFDIRPVQAAFQCSETPPKAACTSQKNASTEFCTKQKYDTGCAQATFCGLGRQQGEIPTVGQNSRHEMQGIKSVFQTARRFRAHTTRPYMNVFKTIRELK